LAHPTDQPQRGPDRLRLARLSRLVALSISLLAWTSFARADDKDEAEKHFRAGVALQKSEDFNGAIAAFETSLRLYPSRAALFNLANCLRAAHRYDEAIDAHEKLLRDYGSELDEPMRSAALAQLQELQNLVGSLDVQVDPPDAEIWIDGRQVGRAPLPRAIFVSPGEHDLQVQREGYERVNLRVEVQSREQVSRQIHLERSTTTPTPHVPPLAPTSASAPPPPQPPPPMQSAPSSVLASTGWITAATGAACLAGATVTGTWALRLDADLNDACKGGHCPVARSGDVNRLDALTTTTNVLTGVGVALTAAGVTMILANPARTPERPSHAPLSLSVGPGVFAATVRQRF